VREASETASFICYNSGMKRDLMQILACPVCKGKLELTVTEENNKEVVSGSLFCPKCNLTYPIEDTIPSLLPPERTAK
jgi:uncharacterized protein